MDDLYEKLVLEILNTKALKNLDYNYVLSKLERFILTNGDIFKKLKIIYNKSGLDKIEKKKEFKLIIKSIRDELRIVYSSFLTEDFFKISSLLESLDEKDINLLLKSHKSTNERINFYEKIYKNIFEFYEKPKKIADLGCGLNPLSYFYIKEVLDSDISYFASDLGSKNMDFLNLFFKKFNISGVAKSYDLCDFNIFSDSNFQTCDLVFLFKVIDSLEQVKKNISKDFLEKISCSNIVVSFPTKSLVAKKNFKMNRRNWFFNFIEKKDWKYEQFEVENELFVMIKK